MRALAGFPTATEYVPVKAVVKPGADTCTRPVPGRSKITADASIRLKANVAGDPPDVVGQEILQGPREQGLPRRDCIVAVPPSWMVMGTAVFPDVPIADEEEFLQLQAEQHQQGMMWRFFCSAAALPSEKCPLEENLALLAGTADADSQLWANLVNRLGRAIGV